MKITISQENSSPISITIPDNKQPEVKSQEKLPIVSWLEDIKSYVSSKKNNNKIKKIVDNNKPALDRINKDINDIIQHINGVIVSKILNCNQNSENDNQFNDLKLINELISSILYKDNECVYEFWFDIHDGHERVKNIKYINNDEFKLSMSSNLINNVWIKYKDTEPYENYDMLFYKVHFNFNTNEIIDKYKLKID